MNSLERLQRVLSGQPADVTPVAPAYLSLYLAARVTELYSQAYLDRLGAGESMPIDHAEDALIRARAILGAYRLFQEQPDWIFTLRGESLAWAQQGEMRRSPQGSSSGCGYADRRMSDDEGTGPRNLLIPSATGYLSRTRSDAGDLWDASEEMQTEADVDRLVPVHTAEELDGQGVFEVTRRLVELTRNQVFIKVGAPSPFWSTYGMLGFQGMMLMMHERPALFDYLLRRKHQQWLEVLRGFAGAGLHGVWIEECLSSAELISPRAYERAVFPSTRDFVAGVNRLGLATIFYYCGDVIPRLPWLRRVGADAVAVEESKKGFTIEIADVIRGLDGVCCVFGNVDAVGTVQAGSRAAIEAEVDRQIALGRQARGFVLSQGSPFPLDTVTHNIDIFMARARRRPLPAM